MVRWLWTIGAVLVVIGLAAEAFGWNALGLLRDAALWLWETILWIPEAAVEAVRDRPETWGIVALGVALMVLARLLGRRRG